MPESKKAGGKEKRRSRLPNPDAIDWNDPGQFVSLDIRSALGVLLKEQEAGRLPKVLAQVERAAKTDPDLAMRFPAALLAFFASCKATTGVAAVSVSPCDVSAMAGRIVIAFNWTDSSAATSNCKVTDFDSLTMTDTTTGTTVGWNSITELQRNAAQAGSPASWFGKTHAGTPAGAFAAGAAVTVNLTFKTAATAWCHTCTPSPLVATVTTTIK